MSLDPRTPVVVGVGQTLRRPSTVDELVEPLDLMVEALERAAEDTGAGRALLERAQSVRVVESLGWRTPDPGALVAGRLGIAPAESVQSATGGNSPQMLVNDTAAAILRGDLDVALITGAEAMYSRRVARKLDTRAPSTSQPEGTPKARVLGLDRIGATGHEMDRQMTIPINVYPLFENAVRAAKGRTIAEHQQVIAGLWSRFSEVAAGNPYAWDRTPMTAEQIGTPTSDNRMVGFPYTKVMNANMQTDQGAALILCSVEAARAAGVSEDRLVFPLGGADAHDQWFVSERNDLHSSPAIAACGRAAMGFAGVGPDDITHVGLYSCFPVAVEIGAEALGFSLDRQLTLTGGLTFGGGPGNNYVTHSIAQLVDKLRGDPGTTGLVNANGWYVTKHSVGVYGTTPPSEGFRTTSVQDEVEALGKREVVEDYEGDTTLETYTVMHDREGAPSVGILVTLLADGRRALANTTDADLMKALTTEDGLIGQTARVRKDGTADLG